jgi:hypothetical protein
LLHESTPQWTPDLRGSLVGTPELHGMLQVGVQQVVLQVGLRCHDLRSNTQHKDHAQAAA